MSNEYQDYLCIGGECDGEYVSIDFPLTHGQRVEATKNRELAIMEEIYPTAVWATQNRYIYLAHEWRDDTGSIRFYLLPFVEKEPWNGFNMLDHLVALAYNGNA